MARPIKPVTPDQFAQLFAAVPGLPDVPTTYKDFAALLPSERTKFVEGGVPSRRTITAALRWADSRAATLDHLYGPGLAEGENLPQLVLAFKAARSRQQRARAADYYRENRETVIAKNVQKKRDRREQERAEWNARAAEQWYGIEAKRRTADALEEDRGE